MELPFFAKTIGAAHFRWKFRNPVWYTPRVEYLSGDVEKSTLYVHLKNWSGWSYLFATDEARELAYSGDWFYLLFAIQVLVMICLGFYILKKNNHLA